MTRAIPTVFGVAATILMAASGHVRSEDFNTWQKNFGAPAAKARKGATGATQTVTIGASQTTASKRKAGADPKETITIHGSPGTASKHKGEIEIQSFGGAANPAPGWPAKIDPGLGLKGGSAPAGRGTRVIEGGGSLKQPCGMGHLGCLDGDPPSGKGFNPKK